MEEENSVVKQENEFVLKKKKHKGLIIALISISVIILVLGGVFAFLYATKTDYVKNKIAMITKNDTDYFRYVMDRNIEKLESKFDEYAAKYKDKKIPDSLSLKGKVNASISGEFGRLFFEQNFDGINNVGVGYEVDVDAGKAVGVLATPSYNDVDIATLGVEYKNESGSLYLAIPSYRAQTIDLTGLLDEEKNISPELRNIVRTVDGYLGLSKDKKPFIDFGAVKDKLSVFKEKFTKEELDKLIHIAYDKVEEAELEKKAQISVNGIEKELNVLTCKLDKQASREVLDAYKTEISSLGINPDSLKGLAELLPDSLKGILDTVKGFIGGNTDNPTVSLEFKFFVDDSGDIQGGSVRVSINETKLKLDCLKETDEENADKVKSGAELSLNGIKVGSILRETEKKDGKTYFDVTVKPGAIIESFVRGGSQYSLNIKGNYSGDCFESSDVDVTLLLSQAGTESASIHLVNKMTAGIPKMPLDTSEENTIDLFNLHETDYIDVPALGKQLIEKIDTINDEKLNNFINGFLEDKLGTDIDEARDMVNSGLAQIANTLVKQKFKEYLGIKDPYDYSKLLEEPKKQDEAYVYSWDILQTENVPVNTVFKVYDHFTKPDTESIDMEQAKADFLMKYADNVYEDLNSTNDFIEKGDTIVFDAAAVLGGIVLKDYSYPGNTAVIGKYEYGEGIDDLLLGMKAGETKDITLTLDERFGAFAGYTGVFRITVTEIRKTFSPEWSERFIVGILGFDSMEACEDKIYEEALAAITGEIPSPDSETIKNLVFDEAINNFDISVYDEETIDIVTKYIDELFVKAEIDRTYKMAGYTEAQAEEMKKSYYKYNIAKFGLVATLCYLNNWNISEAALPSQYNKLALKIGYANGDEMKAIEEVKYGKRCLIDTIFEHQAADYLFNNTQIIW